jgi:hypothetical protein
LACCAVLAAAACGDAEGVEVQPLPPLQRPSAEARAGLPEVRGIWRFAGFEIPAGDTARVRERVYTLVPPGELRIATQRLDSIAGQYVREGAAFPFVGEVRRDSSVAVVAFSAGVGQFAAGRIMRDTLWIELTSFSTAQTWPPGTRAALVRRGGGQPFRRLLGGVAIAPPVDSAAVRDSIRLDSLRRAGGAVIPGAQPVPGQPVPGQVVPGQTVPGQPLPQPGVRPTVPGAQPQRPPVQAQPQQRPPVQAQPQQRPQTQPQRPPAQTQPRPQQPRPQPQRPPVQQQPRPQPPVNQPVDEPPPAPPPVAPNPNAPRDTIRFGNPP